MDLSLLCVLLGLGVAIASPLPGGFTYHSGPHIHTIHHHHTKILPVQVVKKIVIEKTVDHHDKGAEALLAASLHDTSDLHSGLETPIHEEPEGLSHKFHDGGVVSSAAFTAHSSVGAENAYLESTAEIVDASHLHGDYGLDDGPAIHQPEHPLKKW